MFNSSLTSSITGWFSESSAEKKDETRGDEASEKDVTKSTEPVEGVEDSSQKEEKPANEDKVPSTLGKLTSEEMQEKISLETQKMMTSARTFGNYLFGVATEASKKVSQKVTETATTIKKTVEEKSIIGDLNREQQEFLKKKRELQVGDASAPPWVGYQESEAMKQQILALSADKRNFLRNPPSGVQFSFDFDHAYPVAMATLNEDEDLQKMRFELVPKNLKEEVFWRNYFYRVSLIKQSAQLLTLADMTRSTNEQSSSSSSTSSAVVIGSTNTGTTLSRSSSSKSLNKSDAENASNGSAKQDSLDGGTHEIETGMGPEFVSDDFDPSALNPDDLEREMKQLGMEDSGGAEGEIPHWEQELQKELQDYEVVPGSKNDDGWEKEIEDMLSNEAQE